MKPLTRRMTDVLAVLHRAFDDGRPQLTSNEIGRRLGFSTGHVGGHRCSHNGRVMGPAQRVTFALIGLKQRGLVTMTNRRDGLSGTAYMLTGAGIELMSTRDYAHE